MSDFKSNLVNESSARPPAPASKGEVNRGGNSLPSVVKEEANVGRNVGELEKADTTVAKEALDNRKNVEEAVAKLKDYVQSIERNLNFELDDASGLTIIKVYDADSAKLIRQIPSEDIVNLAQKLNQEEPLSLFSAQV